MTSYKIVTIWGGSDIIELRSTDPNVLDWLVSGIRSQNSKCKVEFQDLDPSGEKCAVRIHDIKKGRQDRADPIVFWLIKKLCEQGWKPLELDWNFTNAKFLLEVL
jgi:hypothetical protein